jgi:hypothetical protein
MSDENTGDLKLWKLKRRRARNVHCNSAAGIIAIVGLAAFSGSDT